MGIYPKHDPIRAYREGDEMIVPVRLEPRTSWQSTSTGSSTLHSSKRHGGSGCFLNNPNPGGIYGC